MLFHQVEARVEKALVWLRTAECLSGWDSPKDSDLQTVALFWGIPGEVVMKVHKSLTVNLPINLYNIHLPMNPYNDYINPDLDSPG